MPVGDEAQGSSEWLKYLLGGAGGLQAVLTTVGVSNGGVAAMVINHRTLVTLGFGAVLLSILIGVIMLALRSSQSDGDGCCCLTGLLGGLGTVLLFIGLGITGWAALAEPATAKAPSIDTKIEETAGKLVLAAQVKASGIPEKEEYWVEVDAREYVAGAHETGRYIPLGTPLYQSQLGADSGGDVQDSVTIPLAADTYRVVSVEAWSGAHAGPCGSLEVRGGADLAHARRKPSVLEDVGRAGCVVLRLPR